MLVFSSAVCDTEPINSTIVAIAASSSTTPSPWMRDHDSEEKEKEKARVMGPNHMQTAAGDHPSPLLSYRSRIFSGPPEIAIVF